MLLKNIWTSPISTDNASLAYKRIFTVSEEIVNNLSIILIELCSLYKDAGETGS